MAKTINSNSVVFMDTTDNRKLDVYITSNLPTVQIKNSNTNPITYTPNWTSTPLVLEADAYLDSQDANNKTTFSWYKKNALGVETLVNANAKTITINSNALDDGQLVVYVCKALYKASGVDNGIEDIEQITFTQVTTGANGKDGSSVTILGSYDTLEKLQSAHPTGNAGDAYIVNGNLYVWAVDNERWEDVGNIQGPKGDSGIGIRSTTVTYGVSDTSSTQPTSWQTSIPATAEGKYLWTRTVIDYTDDSIPDTVTYIYAKQGSKGDTGTAGSSVTVSSVQYQEGASATVAPTGTWSNAVVTAAEGKYLWTKTTFSDGKTAYGVAKQGVSGKDGVGINSTTVDYGVSDSATVRPTSWQQDIPVVAEGRYLWTRTVIDYTDASKADTVTYTYTKQGAKGDTGVAGSSVTVSSVQYQEGASATTAPTGTWSPVVVAVAEGKYLWTKTVFSDGKTAYGVAKQGANGKDGVGISSITVDYGVSDNASTKPTTWQQSIPIVAEGKYLWTRTITDYTDASVADTVAYVYAKQGIKGETGVAGSSVTVSSIQYQAGTSATTAPTGTWSDSVVAVSEGNYLWTKTAFSDGKIAYGVAKQGQKGDKGDQGIQGIQGPKGDQGIQGPAGANGKPSYFHIKYSANSNGNPMTETPSTYIGTYVDDQADDSTDYLKYTWSRFVGSQGAKGDQGIAGTNGTDGKTSYLHIAYATSANGSSGFSVSDSANKTYIGQYTDYTEADSTDYTKYKWTLIKGDKGDKGDQGVQGPKGNDGQQLYTWVKYADSPTSGMSNDPAGKTYIGLAYNKTTATESSTYSDYTWSLIKGETGAIGPKGDDGQQYYTWIKYADNASGANMSDSPTGKLYIGLAYNKTTSTESTVATDYTWALFKGDKGDKGATGDKGADAYTVLLTNESHVFAGNVSSAVASSATTQILAYKGTTAQSVTIVSVNGIAANTVSTATGIAGLSFACSALSGTSPTITFTCTTSFVSPNGSIPIVLSVGGVSITKMFTYSIAFKGNTGGTGGIGPQGSPATAYWLMSSASVVQKSASGTVVLTPSTLTFTGKSQTGTNTPIDYGCRWIIAYSTDGSTYTNAYTSTANETTKTFTVDSTYKTIRVRMYLAGGTTTLLDEQIIPIVADGAIGTPGADAVTFQVYSSNGYALSINTPTVTLQTFAYIGDIAITAGATYQWYIYNDTGWSAISGGTNAYLTITREDVAFSRSYMCKMTFGGVEYTSVATIDDKNDENKVFTTKPSNYAAGDLWVVGVDYAPAGVAVGTLLRAEHTNVTYGDVDWVTATKYDKELNDLKDNIETYNQYFSFDSAEGLKISAKDNNGTPSQFSTSLTNERLSFNYGNEAIAYINGTKMNIKEAEIESPLTVTGKYSGSTMLQAPVINIGNFSIIVESNGSLSIVANT